MAEAQTAETIQMPKHGEFCWTEINSHDMASSKPFYTNVFGWQFAQSKSGQDMEYLEFASSGEGYPDGALFELTEEMCGGTMPPAHIAHYVSVDNVDVSCEKAKSLGGSVLFGPADIPNVGRFATIADPTGAAINIITLIPMN